MRNTFLLTILAIAAFAQPTNAQEDSRFSKFNANNIFTGGSLNIGGGTGFFALGGNPEIGYTIAPWLDAGIATNIGYTTFRNDYFTNAGSYTERQKTFNYGVGSFIRLYPVPVIFLQLQPEVNWSSTNVTTSLNNNALSFKNTSNSIIGAVGYSQRVIGQSNFYFMLGMDLGGDRLSPYKDYNNVSTIIIRSGFNVYLNRGRR